MLLKKGIYIYIKFGRPLLLSVMLDWETVKMFSRHQSGLVSDIREEHDIPQRVKEPSSIAHGRSQRQIPPKEELCQPYEE